jgi:hypothetical protein
MGSTGPTLSTITPAKPPRSIHHHHQNSANHPRSIHPPPPSVSQPTRWGCSIQCAPYSRSRYSTSTGALRLLSGLSTYSLSPHSATLWDSPGVPSQNRAQSQNQLSRTVAHLVAIEPGTARFLSGCRLFLVAGRFSSLLRGHPTLSSATQRRQLTNP